MSDLPHGGGEIAGGEQEPGDEPWPARLELAGAGLLVAVVFVLTAGVLGALSLDTGFASQEDASVRDRLVLAAQPANVFTAFLLMASAGAFAFADRLHRPDDEWPSRWSPHALRAVTVLGVVVVAAAAYLAFETGFMRGTFVFQPDNLHRAAQVLSALSAVPVAAVAVVVADRTLAGAGE